MNVAPGPSKGNTGATTEETDDMNATDQTLSNTALDDLSRGVPESALPPERTPEEELARHINIVHRGIAALREMDDKLMLIERAFASSLPEALKGAALGDAVDMVADLKLVMDKIGGEGGSVNAVGKRLNYVREVTMPELFDAAKVKTFNTDRFRVSKTTKLYASINADGGFEPDGTEFAGQPKGWTWLRENGLESLIKPTVNASSLSAAAKELIENGSELPEDLFKVHTKYSVSITKK